MTPERKRRGLGVPAKSMAELVDDMQTSIARAVRLLDEEELKRRRKYPGESLGQSIAARVARLPKREEIPKRTFDTFEELPRKTFKRRLR